MAKQAVAHDIWGEVPTVKQPRTPYTILIDQAKLLTEKTGGVLEGKVNVLNPDPANFHAILAFEVKTIGGKGDIAYVSHQAAMYPVKLQNHVTRSVWVEAKTERAFVEALTNIVKSAEVQDVLQSMIKQGTVKR